LGTLTWLVAMASAKGSMFCYNRAVFFRSSFAAGALCQSGHFWNKEVAMYHQLELADAANLVWYCIGAVAMLACLFNRYLRHFTTTYGNIS
jgi:hypothetical protein